MLKMVKNFAKVFTATIRPTKAKVIPLHAIPAKVETQLPTRDELQTRLVQALQANIDAKLKTFLYAATNYKYDGEQLIDAAAWLGFSEVVDFTENELEALCAAMEWHELDGDYIDDTSSALEKIGEAIRVICGGRTCYTFYPDVADDEDLGDKLCDLLADNYRWSGRFDWLLDYVDWEELARQTRNDEGGCHTTRGYFQYGVLEY